MWKHESTTNVVGGPPGRSLYRPTHPSTAPVSCGCTLFWVIALDQLKPPWQEMLQRLYPTPDIASSQGMTDTGQKSLPDSLPEMGQHLSTTCSRCQAEARVKLASPLPYAASLAPLVSCPETFNKSPPRDPSSQSLPPGAKPKRGS